MRRLGHSWRFLRQILRLMPVLVAIAFVFAVLGGRAFSQSVIFSFVAAGGAAAITFALLGIFYWALYHRYSGQHKGILGADPPAWLQSELRRAPETTLMCLLLREIESTWNKRPGFPRVWELLGFLLPKSTRDRVYQPTGQDLLGDYLESRRYRTKWARRWLAFCFTLRTILVLLECIRVGILDRLIRLLPGPWRRWWMT